MEQTNVYFLKGGGVFRNGPGRKSGVFRSGPGRKMGVGISGGTYAYCPIMEVPPLYGNAIPILSYTYVLALLFNQIRCHILMFNGNLCINANLFRSLSSKHKTY